MFWQHQKTGLFDIKLQGKPNWVKLKRVIKRRPDFSLRNQWVVFVPAVLTAVKGRAGGLENSRAGGGDGG